MRWGSTGRAVSPTALSLTRQEGEGKDEGDKGRIDLFNIHGLFEIASRPRDEQTRTNGENRLVSSLSSLMIFFSKRLNSLFFFSSFPYFQNKIKLEYVW